MGNIFKFRVDTLEHLHATYFSLNLMSNLRSQYLPTNFKSCHDIYNLLIDRRNCISEFSKIKKRNPRKVNKSLKR
jgi:hypothetical protein